jgi:Spy/CpxP family protein refolding chaperone
MKSTRTNQTKKKSMKRNLLALLALSTIAAVGFAVAQEGDAPGGPGGHKGAWAHGGGGPLEHMTTALNLTADQQAKVQPILDQAKPQIQAIHEDAMAKTKAIMDNVMAQVRPLLTADQQKKADEMQQAHQNKQNAGK